MVEEFKFSCWTFNCKLPLLVNFSCLLVLSVFSNGPEEVGKLLIISIGDGSLRTVADDEGPVVFRHTSYWFHSVGTGRT